MIVTRCSECKKYEWAENDFRIEPPAEPVEGINGNISDSLCLTCYSKKIAFINNLNTKE